MRNEMEMNNHYILSNTATWQSPNEHSPKVIISNDGNNRETIINGHESYDNTLIMKSM